MHVLTPALPGARGQVWEQGCLPPHPDPEPFLFGNRWVRDAPWPWPQECAGNCGEAAATHSLACLLSGTHRQTPDPLMCPPPPTSLLSGGGGHFHSTSEAEHCFPQSCAGTGANTGSSEVPLFPFGDRS